MVDFMLAGYPKSGNNWLIHLLQYNIIGPTYNPDQKNTNIFRTESVSAPNKNKIIYIARHPLDVMISFRNYQVITSRVTQNFNTYVDEYYKRQGAPGYAKWGEHIRYWKNYNPWLMKYDDINVETLQDLYRYCGLPVECAEEALDAMSFDKLKAKEAKHVEDGDFSHFKKMWGNPNIKALKEGKGFFNKGESFYFTEYLTQEQIERGYEIFKPEILWPDQCI